MPRRDPEAHRVYMRAYRQGLRRPKVKTPAAVRLLAFIDKVFVQHNPEPLGDCWEFRGAKNSHGYGVLKVDGRMVLAHRLSLSIALGRELDPEKVVSHACDNPPCVRPRHLRETTQLDNVIEMYSRGRRDQRARDEMEQMEEAGYG